MALISQFPIVPEGGWGNSHLGLQLTPITRPLSASRVLNAQGEGKLSVAVKVGWEEGTPDM